MTHKYPNDVYRLMLWVIGFLTFYIHICIVPTEYIVTSLIWIPIFWVMALPLELWLQGKLRRR